jgi:hypothetical protein
MKPLIVRSPFRDDVVAMAIGQPRNSFWVARFPKWSGLAAVLGGLFCAVAAALHSLQPVGCVLAECDGAQPMRSGTPLVGALGTAATLLILIGIAGLTVLAGREGSHVRLAKAGLASTLIGFTLLAVAGLIQALFFAGDFPGMPYFVVPGLLAVVAGLVLIGIFIVRSRVLPRWLGVFLVVSSVALLAANEQAQTVLLAIPFGVAMMATGYFMWSGGRQPELGRRRLA